MPKTHVSLSTTLSASKNRVFKTNWFAKAASKRGIADPALCKAMRDVVEGYVSLTQSSITALLRSKDFVEICRDE
jgi:hypothetical protein